MPFGMSLDWDQSDNPLKHDNNKLGAIPRQGREEQIKIRLGIDITNSLENSKLVALGGRLAIGDVVHVWSPLVWLGSFIGEKRGLDTHS